MALDWRIMAVSLSARYREWGGESPVGVVAHSGWARLLFYPIRPPSKGACPQSSCRLTDPVPALFPAMNAAQLAS